MEIGTYENAEPLAYTIPHVVNPILTLPITAIPNMKIF